MTAKVVSLTEWQDRRESERIDAWAECEARKLGYASYADLEADVVEQQHAEMQNDPTWKEYVRECRIHRRLERSRRRK